METVNPSVKLLWKAQWNWTFGILCFWCIMPMAASCFEDALTAGTRKLMKGEKKSGATQKCWRTTCCDLYEPLELPGKWPKQTAILRFQMFSVLAWPCQTQSPVQLCICKMTFKSCTQTVSTELESKQLQCQNILQQTSGNQVYDQVLRYRLRYRPGVTDRA